MTEFNQREQFLFLCTIGFLQYRHYGIKDGKELIDMLKMARATSFLDVTEVEMFEMFDGIEKACVKQIEILQEVVKQNNKSKDILN